ncbi:MAG: hypothetical protein F8N39_16005 [Clostridiaceae bacterium]|nr:hypothetical protein [Clostridiaceae bacterium]
MSVNLRGRHFLALEELTPVQVRYLLDLAHQLKAEKKSGIDQRRFNRKNLLMLFEMNSTRTRCSFETSASDLGMGTTYLVNSHFGTKETIEDSMNVFTAMYDLIVYRGQDHEQLKEMASIHMLPSSHNCKHKAEKELVKILDKETADFVSKGLEVTDEVFTMYKDVIFREAENRQHTIKAVLSACVGE